MPGALRLVVAGGGTGGHLYPGIAVARVAVSEGAEALFIGAEGGIEERVVPREGFRLVTVGAGKLKGQGAIGKLRTLFLIPVGVMAAMKALREFRPDVVLGVGGYASFPVVAAARILGIRSVIQEQNSFPGLTNRALGRFVDRVALGFWDAARWFPADKATLTGNPVRADIMDAARDAGFKRFGLSPDKQTVLVFGGSGGARTINMGVSEALGFMPGLKDRVQFIHQTGEKDHNMVESAYRESGFTAHVSPFIYEMADAYATADLVVCRSGALTLAELTALGKPAVLIPYPYAADNHQELNARSVEKVGAALVLLDKDASGERLAGIISGLLDDPDTLRGMSARSRSLGRPDAARKVLEICREVAGLG